MPTYDEDVAKLAELKAEIAVIEQRLAEDPQRDATLQAASALIQVDSVMNDLLSAVAAKSEVHPEWVNIDFPLDTATGTKAMASRFAIREFIALGGEPGFKLGQDGSREAMPGRVYFPASMLADAIERLSQLQEIPKP